MKATIVVDDELCRRITALAEFDVLWIVDTPGNRAGEAILSEHSRKSVTWFAPYSGDETSMIRDLLEMIEDHHGPFATAAPWRELVVFGLKDPAALAHAVADYSDFSCDVQEQRIIRRAPRVP